MVEQIFVKLLNEAVDVWRPVPAYRIDPATYIVLRSDGYDPDSETREFPPGSVVICEDQSTADGAIFAAVRRRELDKRTA